MSDLPDEKREDSEVISKPDRVQTAGSDAPYSGQAASSDGGKANLPERPSSIGLAATAVTVDPLVTTSQSQAILGCLPAPVRGLFGSPPLLKNEDANQYYKMLATFSDALCPKDALECVWLKDYVDLQWEIQRLRRMKAALVNGAELDGIEVVFKSIFDDGKQPEERLECMAKEVARHPERDKKLQEGAPEFMTVMGERIGAEAFVYRIKDLAALERMLADAERRRNNALREMERRRRSLMVARWREASQKLIEGNGEGPSSSG